MNVPFLSKMLGNFGARLAACVVSGLLLCACFPLLNWNGLAWIAVLPLLAACMYERQLLRAFQLGYVAGCVFIAGSCYWLFDVMRRYGGLGPLLSLGVLVLFVLVFSVYYGLFAWLTALAARRGAGAALFLAPFLWVALELARTYLITGFPWNLLGYAVPADGLRQLASVTGVYGLSFLCVSMSALLAWVAREPGRARPKIAVAMYVVLLFAGSWLARPAADPPGDRVAFLLQPNIPLDESSLERWAPWRDPAPLERLVALTEDSVRRRAPETPVETPLVVWPENPAPFYFGRDAIFRGALEGMVRATRSDMITGTTMFAGPGGNRPLNAAVVLDPTGKLVFEYDKIHLVPFGEYVPRWAFPGKIKKITFEVGDFIPGTRYEAARTSEGGAAISICYEDIFPQLVRRLAPPGPGVLVNISDDGWYGDSAGPQQHLEMARFRAIENGRYLLRATNDGFTVIVDPHGRITERLPRHEARVLAGRFSYRSERTLYARFGDFFAWLCVVIAAGMTAWGLIEARPAAATQGAGSDYRN